jgi:predicted RNA-binding protein YlxR (DUF448 family)
MELARLVVKKGQVFFDITGKISGRGAYLCKNSRGLKESCFRKAKERNAFKYAFRQKVKVKNL